MKRNSINAAFIWRVAMAWVRRSPWVVVFAMLVSISSTWIAGQEVKTMVKAIRTGATGAGAVASLKKESVTPPELAALSTMLMRVTPTVSMKPEGKRLKVWIDSAGNYPDWVLALSTLQTYQKGLVWDVKVICTSCDGKAAYAEVEPYVQRIVWK